MSKVPAILVAAGLVAITVRADQFPDTHGDDAASATALSLGVVVNGEVEIDIDRDWFAFTANPGKQYAVQGTPGSLQDATVSLHGLPGGIAKVATFNSVGSAQADLTWVNPGGPMSMYVEVGGFVDFATGTYNVVVFESDVVDSEGGTGDGLPDAWELDEFENLLQGPDDDPDLDGLTNLEEFKAGTDPNDPQSGLHIVRLESGSPQKEVSWPASPLRVYQVLAAPSMVDPAWQVVGSVTGTSFSVESYLDPNPGAPGVRFYGIGIAD